MNNINNSNEDYDNYPTTFEQEYQNDDEDYDDHLVTFERDVQNFNDDCDSFFAPYLDDPFAHPDTVFFDKDGKILPNPYACT